MVSLVYIYCHVLVLRKSVDCMSGMSFNTMGHVTSQWIDTKSCNIAEDPHAVSTVHGQGVI